ncbi:MAG: translation elongation factor Ts [Rhodospirillales bacterium]|jgi:elongation factor Ts|nr:elongation factor Ts [Rhodospirillaceae bacterium]MDP6430127.1 translation elongation factor Ts [Rhodospirillales bacterium]MDP6645631.1 translation elongation factor Ts [Rhodospirillales bacterium]|tara:strand:- start:967 stop:1893 length:927 start_codon:yes stop_codon:yes gene_type:complete
MAEITAALVKQLREKTGAGMMDCKRALTENGGDLEASVDWLRTQGLAAAAKKAGRAASEGLVGVAAEGGTGALVEINAETDFVARNESFQDLVVSVTDIALSGTGDLEELKEKPFPGGEGSVGETVTSLIATIGENMELRRSALLNVENGVVATYMHNALKPGLGKIGVLVALESDGDTEKLEAFGKQLAMHVAAANPRALSQADVDPAELKRERSVLSEQARESGKPEEIIEKMVDGRLRKYFEEICLLDQTFVIDGESKVAKAVEAAAKELGAEINVAGFCRFALGEGVEKKEEDFAAEVAAAAGG